MVFGQHAFDGKLNYPFRTVFHDVGQLECFQVPNIAAVPIVQLLLHFFARHPNVGGVENDDEIAGNNVGSVAGLVLALQSHGYVSSHPAQGLARSVDYSPITGNFPWLGEICASPFHFLYKPATKN